MPAPKGNRYAARHGVRAFLTNGSLPEGCSRITGQVGRFRVTLESEVVKRKGELSLYDSAVCQSAMRFETVVLLWERWLRLHAAEMSIGEKLNVTTAIAKASRDRDECLKALGLHLDPHGTLRTLDALYADDEPAKSATHSTPAEQVTVGV